MYNVIYGHRHYDLQQADEALEELKLDEHSTEQQTHLTPTLKKKNLSKICFFLKRKLNMFMTLESKNVSSFHISGT